MEWLIGGAVVSGVGKIWAADKAADAMEESARVARIQAEIALEQGKFTAKLQKERGVQEAQFREKQSRLAVGGEVARVAGSGVEIAGSPLVLIGNHIREDEINIARTLTNANMAAFSSEAQGRGQAAGYMAQAASLNKQADITRVVGYLDAISMGINAAGTAQMMSGGVNTAPGKPTDYSIYGT